MTDSPSPQPTPARTGSLTWVWGLLGALLLAAGVGYGVFFFMQRAHLASVDAQVEQAVAEQMAAMAQMPQGPPPTMVRVAEVATQRLQQRVVVVGRLEEVRRAVVASQVEGRVMELLTPAGRQVVGGETVIARVDPTWSQLALEQAQADLAAAQAIAAESASELALLEGLASRSAADPQALEEARAQAASDAAVVLARQAAVNLATQTRERVEVVAPFDGTVSAKLTEEGQWVDPGSPVVEIVSRGHIDAVIDMPEAHIAAITPRTEDTPGTMVDITIEALGQTLSGEVVAINPDGSNAARTYPVKVRISDQDGLLRVGMSVTARVPIAGEGDYLVVPRDAVQYADNGPQVWLSLVMPGSPPGSMPQGMPMDVDVLFGEGDVFAINPQPKVAGMGLGEGMPVVIEGAERLWPTRPLIVMPPGDVPLDQMEQGGGPPGGGQGGPAAEGEAGGAAPLPEAGQASNETGGE